MKQAKEAAGEEKKEARVEGGWGEEPKRHVSGVTGGHTKREMRKMMLMPEDRVGKDPKTKTGQIEDKNRDSPIFEYKSYNITIQKKQNHHLD